MDLIALDRSAALESSATLSIEQLTEHWLRWAIGLLTGFALA